MSEKNVNNVDQIRDLIFGSQIKEFEAKFEQIEKALERAEKGLLKIFSDTHDKLKKETGRSLEMIEKKIDNFALSTQKERAKLKELIDTTDESLHARLMTQKEEFSDKLKAYKENISDEQKKVLDEIGTIRREQTSVVDERISAMGEDKLSRDMMSQMLLEVAMKIRGTDLGSAVYEGVNTETK